MRRVRARDNESPEESDEIRYMVYALDAGTGKIKWEREAHTGQAVGGRHRKNTYASETPFTDGERLYVSFGQNVGLFCYTLDGTLLWKKQWPPQPIYLDFGTASSPIGPRRPRLSAARQRGRVVPHRARRQDRRGDLAHRAGRRPAFRGRPGRRRTCGRTRSAPRS